MVSHGSRKAVRRITPLSQFITLIVITLFFTPTLQVVSAQNAPDPWVSRAIYVNGVELDPNNPPSITLGEMLRIEVGGIIKYLAAEEAYLTISFPDLTSTSSYLSITGGTAPNKNRYPPGYNGYGCYGGCRVTFSYWVVEAWATPWPRDVPYTLFVAVKPERVGDFKVHVKITARAGNTWYADPTTNGQAKNQPPGRVVLDQQQREYVYEFTVKVNPPSGNLVVNIHNIPGYPLPARGGNIMVYLYRGNYESYVTSRSVSFSGGESFKSVSFENLPQGSYTIEVYQAPPSSIAGREFWGAGAVQVAGGQTTTHEFYRHTQVVSGVSPIGLECSVVVGQELRPVVTVKNYDSVSKETRIRLIIDRDRASPYDYDRTTDPITIPSNSQRDFTLPPFQPSQQGQYYYYVVAEGLFGPPQSQQYVVTDQWYWSEACNVRQEQVDTIPPTVRVLAPNGGETLTVGQTFRITWEASDNVGISRIHIWLFQGGSQVAVIAANQPNTGYYDWAVLDRPGAGYKIRIAAVDAAGNVGYDDSDGTFNIQQQPTFDFSLSVSPTTLSVSQGQQAVFTISVGLVGGQPQQVSLTLTGLPSYVGTYAFNPQTGTPSFTSTLTINVMGDAPVGTYTLTVTATSGGLTRTATITLNIQQQPPQTGSLTIRIHNIRGLRMPQSSGSLEVSLYTFDATRNQWIFVGSRAVTYQGGVEYVSTSFSSLVINRDYYFEVWQTLASGLRLKEFWGRLELTLTAENPSVTLDFYRSRPYITNINYPSSAQSGGQITFNITAKNEDTVPRPLFLTVILDRDLRTPFDVMQNSITFTLASGETRTISIALTAPAAGTYKPYIVLSFYYPSDPSIHGTVYDQWDGSTRPIEIIAQQQVSLSVQPTSWSPTVQAGSSASQTFTVSVSGGTARGVTVSRVSGPSWLAISPTNLGDIASGQSRTFTATASPPSGTSGQFSYMIRVSGSNTELVEIQGTINVQQQPSATAKAQIGIRHTWIGDLRIWIGVQGGREVLIWNREGGSADDIFREFDLFQLGFTQNDLPPSENKRWYLKVSDEGPRDTGGIEYFKIIYQGQVYESQDHPEIRDYQEAIAWIPSASSEEWVKILSKGLAGPDNTEVVYEFKKFGGQGPIRVGERHWFMFTVEIRDRGGVEPRDSSPFIRGGKLYICYERREGPDLYMPRWLEGTQDTIFGWYYTEYRQWSRVLQDTLINAMNERGAQEIAEQLAINSLFGAISLLPLPSEVLTNIKDIVVTYLDIIFNWLGIDVLPDYAEPTPPDDFIINVYQNKNQYMCNEQLIITPPRYRVGTDFEGITGWSVDFELVFPQPGKHQIIMWFYIQMDREGRPDAFVKPQNAETIIMEITS